MCRANKCTIIANIMQLLEMRYSLTSCVVLILAMPRPPILNFEFVSVRQHDGVGIKY